MNIHLYFSTGNAAFDDGALPFEAARIFREQADRIEEVTSLAGFEATVRDINGNRVGTFFATEKDEISLEDKPLIHAHLETGNAAFEDVPGAEVARILRAAANKLEDGETEFGLRDYNGNRVGGVELQAAEPEADNDNDGGSGSKPPREPLLGDVMKDEHGDAWMLVRTEMVNNRKGVAKLEPLFIFVNEDDSDEFKFLFDEQIAPVFGTELDRTFSYTINLDERGEFYADVRQENGESIFEVRSNDDGVIEMVEDGFMNDTRDVTGLADHLVSLGLMYEGDKLLGWQADREHDVRLTELSVKGAEAWKAHNAPRASAPDSDPSP